MTEEAFTISDYLIERLHALGARHVHAVPGDYVASFLDAVDSGSKLTRLAHANELEAGYAADAAARFRGLAVLCVQYGVGTYSALNAIAGAYEERSPLVVLTGSPSRTARALIKRGLVFHHSTTPGLVAGKKVLEPLTVASSVIEDAANAPAEIDRALVAALTESRPIYLEFWEDLWTAPCARPLGELAASRQEECNEAALAEALDDAWGRLQRARLPVIWAGIEIQRFGLQKELARLLDASGLPYTTTILAKTVLGEDHPQFFGAYAAAASPPQTAGVMEAADCVLALGTIQIDYYRLLVVNDYSCMVHATEQGVRIGNHVYHGVALEDFVAGLIRIFEDHPRSSLPSLPVTAPDPAPGEGPEITYERLFARAQLLLDDSLVVVCDLSIAMFLSAGLRIPRADGYLANATWASIGYAAPAAIGVAKSGQGRPLVFAGDGGFQMMAQAMSTHVALRTCAIVLVMNNGVYGIEQLFTNLRAYTDDEPFNLYNELPSWDYAALARSVGARGVVVSTMTELDAALDEAKACDDVVLIDVKMPKRNLPEALLRLVDSFKPPAG